MILFLNMDGVLHPEACYKKEKLLCHHPRFETFMREILQVEIVISSTPRKTQTIGQLQDLFTDEITRRIVGATPDWHDFAELFSVIGDRPCHVENEDWLAQSERPWERSLYVSNPTASGKAFFSA